MAPQGRTFEAEWFIQSQMPFLLPIKWHQITKETYLITIMIHDTINHKVKSLNSKSQAVTLQPV